MRGGGSERCACGRDSREMCVRTAGIPYDCCRERERCAAAGTQERCACGTAWCSTARGGGSGGGEDVRAVAAVGEMRPLPSPVQMDLDYPIFFHPIESNPNGSKAMDIHIQLDPNPIEFMGQNPFGFGFSPIHSQE